MSPHHDNRPGQPLVIEAIPFLHVGYWRQLPPEQKSNEFGLEPFRFDQPAWQERVVYAFADGEPLYLGACGVPETTLAVRMGRYLSTKGRSTSQRITPKIVVRLVAGKRVDIYAYRPPFLVCDSLRIDPVLSVEERLIQLLKPAGRLPWNDLAKCKRPPGR